ncbi:MAG: PrgI family protein [Patescibacteria group bacterium]|nr:PrgI family protein [Patescibacteria group bacterium]
MQFQIPQFIETEDKIAGPLTLKQLLYFIGAGAVSFLAYAIFSFWLWFLITVILAAISASFAFLKYNGQPLIKIAFSALEFFWNPRLYVWQREAKMKTYEVPGIEEKEEKIMQKRESLGESFGMPSIKKLWDDLVTTKNPIPQREKSMPIAKIMEKLDVFRKITGEKEKVKRVDFR